MAFRIPLAASPRLRDGLLTLLVTFEARAQGMASGAGSVGAAPTDVPRAVSPRDDSRVRPVAPEPHDVSADGSVLAALPTESPTATTSAAETPEAAPRTKPRRAAPRFRPLTLTANPLSLVYITRLSFNVEVAVAPHHVLMLNPYYGDSTLLGSAGSLWRLGGVELGYRAYSRSTGAHGGFIGVFAGAAYGAIDNRCSSCAGVPPKLWFSAGVDAGHQWVMNDGFTVGVGGGFAVHWTDDDVVKTEALPLPRLLLTLGVTP